MLEAYNLGGGLKSDVPDLRAEWIKHCLNMY